jgi:hypothetical protein
MDKFDYREILDKNLKQTAKKFGLGNKFTYQHVNDPKHISVILNNWLEENKIETLKWPHSSLDQNPIEHMWDELESRIKQHHLYNKEEPKKVLQQEWVGIGNVVPEKLIDSVPDRLYECLPMKDYRTPYWALKTMMNFSCDFSLLRAVRKIFYNRKKKTYFLGLFLSFMSKH